ncbi:MAG: hypothetical protein JWN46_89 [Acidimicrobiales bacterium]|nr:hypothetical protein [Acidimicrobiales bacterium]
MAKRTEYPDTSTDPGVWDPWHELAQRSHVEFEFVDMPVPGMRGLHICYGDVAVILLDERLRSGYEAAEVLTHELIHDERPEYDPADRQAEEVEVRRLTRLRMAFYAPSNTTRRQPRGWDPEIEGVETWDPQRALSERPGVEVLHRDLALSTGGAICEVTLGQRLSGERNVGSIILDTSILVSRYETDAALTHELIHLERGLEAVVADRAGEEAEVRRLTRLRMAFYARRA